MSAVEGKRVQYRYCHLCGRTGSICFSFPKHNLEKRKEWLLFCGIADSDTLSVPFLCEKHFEPKFIQKKQKTTTLHGFAVPTIRIESPSIPVNEGEPAKKKYFRNCCVCGPTDSHLHKFPKDDVRKKEWLDLLNLKGDERKYLLLCSSHFPAGSVLKMPQGKVVLKRDAKPVVVEREKATDIALSASTIDYTMPEHGTTPSQIDTARSIIQTSATTNSTSPDIETVVPEIETYTSASDKIGLNQITVKKVRQSLLQLLNSERVETELSEIPQHNSELDTSNVTVESNNAPLQETAEITLAYEPTEPRTSDTSGNMSTPKRRNIRYLADINTPSLETPRTRKKCLCVIRTYQSTMGKRMRLLKQQNSRLKTKITNLKSLIANLKEKNMITENAATTLLNDAPAGLHRIIRRKLQGKTQKFSKDLMAFALTLQFYSTRAYAYVRKSFDNLLPCLSTLKKRRQRVDTRPGFMKEAFHFLQNAAKDRPMVINLCIDDMSIREHIDSRGDRDYGYCDLGTFIGEEGDKVPAKNCLTFLAVNLKENFRIPVAYFLISSLSGSERANLLRLCITSLHEINVHVKSITFDGASVNTTMCEILGANFAYKTKFFKPFFPHPVTKEKIFIFFDPCHMLKLLRNRFGLAHRNKFQKCNFIYDYLKRKISFEELELLVSIQESEGLHAANKLTRQHLEFQKKIMNVSLAAQVFSASVSDALKLLQELGKIPPDSGTPELCGTVNDIFDALNCRTRFTNPYKKPKMRVINEANLQEIKKDCAEWIQYIEKLTDEDRTPCYTSGRKTGFLGIIICLQNITALYEELRDKYGQEYFLTYRVLQDYIENFFGSLRARGGYNDNPSALQLEIAMKYLLIHTEIRSSENGNCEWVDLEDLNALTTGDHIQSDESLPIAVRSIAIDSDELLDIEMEDDDFTDTGKFSDFQQECIKYITGFAVRKILPHTSCLECRNQLRDMNNENDCKLLRIKNRGYLTIPSTAVSRLGFICETAFRASQSFLGTKTFFQKMKNEVIANEDLVKFHSEHHDYILDFFVQIYFNVRKHYENKKLIRKGCSNRNVRKRITIFTHE